MTLEKLKSILVDNGIRRARIYEAPLGILVIRVPKKDYVPAEVLQKERPVGVAIVVLPDLSFFEQRWWSVEKGISIHGADYL